MQDKKATLLRIVIFLVLSFVPLGIIGAFFTDGNANLTSSFAGMTIMLYPALANILTRLITREGMRKSFLGFGGRDCAKYYLAAMLIPVVTPILGGISMHLFAIDNGSISESLLVGDGRMAITMVLMQGMIGFATLFRGFGEEFGWRAYLTPKLEEFMPTPAAVTVTGVIWALWHGPLLVQGYNFGKDYDFFPYGGFIAMTIMCIFMSALLTWLTKRTKSVYPAAICHILVDTLQMGILNSFVIKSSMEAFDFRVSSIWQTIIAIFPGTVIFGAIAMLFLIKDKRKNRTA